MAQTEIAELLIRVRNLEEQVQTLTNKNRLLRQAENTALNMAERAVFSACDVLSFDSNISGWQVQNKKTQLLNDIESLRCSFTMQDS